MDKRSGKIIGILVLLLFAATLAAGYFLFFHPYEIEPTDEIAAELARPRPVAPDQPSLTGQLSPEEIQKLNQAETVVQFASILDRPRFDWTVYTAERPTPVFPAATEDVPVAETVAREPTQPGMTASVTDSEPIDQTAPVEPDIAETAPVDVAEATPAEVAEAGPEEVASVNPEAGQVADTNVPRGKFWVINAMSTQEPEKAARTIASLQKTPHMVYQYEAEVKGQKWLRVRVGFFKDREEAERTGLQLAKEFDLPEPWIVTPGPLELAQYYKK
jgi:cell division septation protein DedD